jgi:hypothetical protein
MKQYLSQHRKNQAEYKGRIKEFSRRFSGGFNKWDAPMNRRLNVSLQRNAFAAVYASQRYPNAEIALT